MKIILWSNFLRLLTLLSKHYTMQHNCITFFIRFFKTAKWGYSPSFINLLNMLRLLELLLADNNLFKNIP